MESFRASTQYGNWEGTAAADGQPSSLDEYLRENGLIKPSEFLVAASLHVGEHDFCSVRAFVFERGSNFESANAAISASSEPIPVRRVQIKLNAQEFMLLFKRFSVLLTRHGLQLEGREYDATEG
jgi:hypothetical protein